MFVLFNKIIKLFHIWRQRFVIESRARNGPPGPMDRPGPTRILSRAGRAALQKSVGRVGQIFCRAGPTRSFYLFFTFHQLFCSLQMIEIIRKDFFVGKLCGFNDGNIMKSISFLNWSYFSSTCSVM